MSLLGIRYRPGAALGSATVLLSRCLPHTLPEDLNLDCAARRVVCMESWHVPATPAAVRQILHEGLNLAVQEYGSCVWEGGTS